MSDAKTTAAKAERARIVEIINRFTAFNCVDSVEEMLREIEDSTKAFLGAIPCARCQLGGFGPDHDGSPRCRMGTSIAAGGIQAHCTCGACF